MTKPELALYAKQDGTGRAYKHPFRTGPDGKALSVPSVTTVLNLVSKGDSLVQWAVNQTMEWVVANRNRLFTMGDESVQKGGKYRWKDFRDERAEVGTGIHETIEAEHTGTWNYPALDDEQKQIMGQWALFNERYEVTPHLSEFTVWSLGYEYAGTADGLWDVVDLETGESWEGLIIDIKTSKNTWPEHWMQLSALRRAGTRMEKLADGTWTEHELPLGGGVGIVHLRADKFELLVEDDPNLIDIWEKKFLTYRELWTLNADEKDYIKERELDNLVGF